MENESAPVEQVTTRSVGIRFGLFLALASIAFFLIMIVAGIDMMQGPARYGTWVFYFAFIFLAHKNFKENGNGFMSYGQGLGITFWIALVSSVIGSIFTWVYVKYIDSGFIQQMMDKQEEAFVAQGMSQEQIRAAMDMTAKFMTPEMMLVFGIVGGLAIIMIVGLIVTAFTKKNSPDMPI
jgi:hypothetical protein